MLSIGETARASGLSVSALRFYDGAGVFGPARVDPRTGYRWYAPEQLADARMIARLRRVGMPLADLARVLDGDRAAAEAAVDAHLARLEAGLADARRELSAVRALLDPRENPMQEVRLTVPAAALAAALDAVRFAVTPTDEHPSLAGVLFEAEGGTLRLVGTDRYRLAVAEAPAEPADRALSVIVPTVFTDALRPLLGAAPTVELTLDGTRITADAGGHRLAGERIDRDYPDYRALLRLDTTHRVEVGVGELSALLTDAEDEVSALVVGPDGTLTVDAAGSDGDGLRVRVDRGYLLQALAAGAAEQLVLELGGPIAPLAIRFADRADTFSLLMPVAP
ncbi:MerR family transcriptional regulator [Kitasatospora camelliae]|uniref:MerR family transcriptional regulator n=1 Tax=Kitasatospora camelliae TaxID=3156397 RepID=A0AAU8JSY3_9ACTN